MKVIDIKNVSFRYDEEKPFVIKNLSLSVDKGDFLCVLGENGSGKSTLSRLINGLLTPTDGSVEVYSLSTSDKKSVKEIRKKVGMVFQNPDNQMVATIVEDDIANVTDSETEVDEIETAEDVEAMQNIDEDEEKEYDDIPISKGFAVNAGEIDFSMFEDDNDTPSMFDSIEKIEDNKFSAAFDDEEDDEDEDDSASKSKFGFFRRKK
jgi:ABC-type oligopeptide transport system ATPase subunit